MAGDSLNALLSRSTPPTDEDDENLGPCAARAKDRWVTALTVKHHKKAWESFQYVGIATRSTFTPTKFEVAFVEPHCTYRLTVTGRNLWVIYNNITQHRCEWIEAAVRDVAADREPVILGVEVVEVEAE